MIMKNKLAYIISISLILLPLVTNAQSGIKFQMTNFLNFNSIEDLVVGILNILIVIAIPIIVFFIIYAGFMYVTASGNPEQIKQASRSLTYAIIGGVLIIGALAIAEIIKGLVSSLT